MFGFTVWLVIGGIVGWFASLLKKTAKQQDILANIIVGIVSAYIGGALFAPMVRATPPTAHLIALLGALIAVGVYTLARRTRRG